MGVGYRPPDPVDAQRLAMGVGQAIALAVIVFAAATEPTTVSAQKRSDSAQGKELERIFRTQTRDVLHPNIERLENALNELISDPLAKEMVTKEIDLARNTLDKAIAARRYGRESNAQRAEKLVEAALVLANRKLALERVRTALRDTKREAEKAEKATQRAEEALEAAMQRRAKLYLGQKK